MRLRVAQPSGLSVHLCSAVPHPGHIPSAPASSPARVKVSGKVGCHGLPFIRHSTHPQVPHQGGAPFLGSSRGKVLGSSLCPSNAEKQPQRQDMQSPNVTSAARFQLVSARKQV